MGPNTQYQHGRRPRGEPVRASASRPLPISSVRRSGRLRRSQRPAVRQFPHSLLPAAAAASSSCCIVISCVVPAPEGLEISGTRCQQTCCVLTTHTLPGLMALPGGVCPNTPCSQRRSPQAPAHLVWWLRGARISVYKDGPVSRRHHPGSSIWWPGPFLLSGGFLIR